jgi:hypothetical protein
MIGPAMMEPEVRIDTNRHGFCKKHMGMLREKNAVLPLALLLDTYVERLQGQAAFALTGGDNSKKVKSASAQLKLKNQDCYICSRIDNFFMEEIDTIFLLYKREKEFKNTIAEQEYFCLPHLEMLLNLSSAKLFGKEVAAFSSLVAGITKEYLKSLQVDLNWFCKKFDYGNKDKEWGNSKDSIERAFAVLRGR